MQDLCARNITYLRLSVTDLCSLRCRYCMPAGGVPKRDHGDICSVEELVEITQASVDCGVRKVRLTGGEPLVRRGILDICQRISAISEVEELCLTTNGAALSQLAKPLREAGVDRLNVSLDTLRPDRYAYMTRGGKPHPISPGGNCAERLPGPSPHRGLRRGPPVPLPRRAGNGWVHRTHEPPLLRRL